MPFLAVTCHFYKVESTDTEICGGGKRDSMVLKVLINCFYWSKKGIKIAWYPLTTIHIFVNTESPGRYHTSVFTESAFVVLNLVASRKHRKMTA